MSTQPDRDLDFSAVPSADDSAVVDPQFTAMRGNNGLPLSYLPPAMSGSRPRWMRVVALGLIAIFLTATAAGICLTYGPPVFGG